MSGHTRGPWLVAPHGSRERPLVLSPDGGIVADLVEREDVAEVQANARLIAKAPELLELVRGVIGLERRKLLKDKGARAWVGACEALLRELGEPPERAEGEE